MLVPTVPHAQAGVVPGEAGPQSWRSQALWIHLHLSYGDHPYEHEGKENYLECYSSFLPACVSAITPIKLLLTWLPLALGNPSPAYLRGLGSEGPLTCDLLYLKTFSQIVSDSHLTQILKFGSVTCFQNTDWLETQQGQSLSLEVIHPSRSSRWTKDTQSQSLSFSKFRNVPIKGPIRALKEISEEEKKFFSEWPHEKLDSEKSCWWIPETQIRVWLRRQRHHSNRYWREIVPSK